MISRPAIYESALTLPYFAIKSRSKFAFCSLPYSTQSENKKALTPINLRKKQE